MIKNENAIYEHEKFKLEPGDSIVCQGVRATVEKVYHQEWYEDTGFIVEFMDTEGNYRNWKQYLDGGQVIERTKGYRCVERFEICCFDTDGFSVPDKRRVVDKGAVYTLDKAYQSGVILKDSIGRKIEITEDLLEMYFEEIER